MDREIPTFQLDLSKAITVRSSGGWLPKWTLRIPGTNRHIWVKTSGQIEPVWFGEAYAEVIASAVCKDLGYDSYVTYHPCIVQIKQLSTKVFGCYSNDFCNDIGKKLVTFQKLLRLDGKTTGLNIWQYKDFLEYIKRETGVNIQKQFEDMLFLDYLIGNIDRGTHNMGLLVDRNERFEIAPIFDNGSSLGLNGFNQDQYLRQYRYGAGYTALPFDVTFEEQLELIRKSRVYRTDFKETKKVIEWIWRNGSQSNNRYGVINPVRMGCFQHIVDMLTQNYNYYKQTYGVV